MLKTDIKKLTQKFSVCTKEELLMMLLQEKAINSLHTVCGKVLKESAKEREARSSVEDKK